MRLQLHKDFTFADAAALAPDLVGLGISHVYLSPILTARAGSTHGYDVIDPGSVNPELGGEAGFRDLVTCLRAVGLGLIVDIVPNHMAVGGSENPWWADLLRHGRSSKYANFFDVDWEVDDPDLRGKVLAPFLGRQYGEALADGEIRLARKDSGDLFIHYHDSEFPVNPDEQAYICECGLGSFDPGNSDGLSNLHALLERQHYRLAWWGAAGDEINWRRFFDINGLAGLRIEVPEVFEAAHATLFRLYADGLIDGFRVDHVDGLSNPPEYCRRLRQRLEELEPGKHAYLVIEKILGAGESLPADWRVDGTSGYDFMNEVNALQHDASSTAVLGQMWHEATKRPADFAPEEARARLEVLQRGFDSQLRAVTSSLHRVARSDLSTRDFSAAEIRRGLLALLSHFPVYRGYDAGSERSALDQAVFAKALTAAKRSCPGSGHAVLDQLDRWLGGKPGDKVAGTRFQQLSAPVAAKAVEDTAFYRYGRLLSRNDVGFDAGRLGSSVAEFHQACVGRLASFPGAMLATATHDHKRGEDVRARLAVLSEIPDQWSNFLAQCFSMPAKRPDPADEIMLYQMVIGAWPLEFAPSDAARCEAFAHRLAGWQEKALREAKLHTDWTTPNEEYEATARGFLFERLSPNSEFLRLAHAFVEVIARAGAVNSLAQAVLKMTVPGVPDFFQGTEFWDFSLVDPDNRRPVDYDARRAAFANAADPARCLISWRDGHVKQAVIREILGLRRDKPNLFSCGDYRPLSVNGPRAESFIAFARCFEGSSIIVIVPRLIQALLPYDGRFGLDADRLRGETVSLPDQLVGREYRARLSGNRIAPGQPELSLEALLCDFPIAVLANVDSA